MSARSFECLSGSIFGQRTIQGQASGENLRKILKVQAGRETGGQRESRERLGEQPFTLHVRD